MIMAIAVASVLMPARSANVPVAADTLTARDVFVDFPVSTLDLLSRSMRLDMLDYYDADSIYNVKNAMSGESHLEKVSPSYLKVVLTAVSTLEIKLLPYKGKHLVMSIYTVGSENQAPDSDVRFFDEKLNPLDRKKFLKTPSLKDFFRLGGENDMTEKELKAMVPFTTIEYDANPDADAMTARLTVGCFLDRDSRERLARLEKAPLGLAWNGRKWVLL